MGLSDSANQVLWTRCFIIALGYTNRPAIIFQDNKSTIQLITNGRSNSGRTRHVDIRFFFLTDRIKGYEINVTYKPTNEMLADMLTKPLQGEQFNTQHHLSIPLRHFSSTYALPKPFYYFGQNQPYVLYESVFMTLQIHRISSALRH